MSHWFVSYLTTPYQLLVSLEFDERVVRLLCIRSGNDGTGRCDGSGQTFA